MQYSDKMTANLVLFCW